MQVCMLLHWGPHSICIKVKRAKELPGWTFIILVFVCYVNYKTVRIECCLAERNSAHVLVSVGIC